MLKWIVVLSNLNLNLFKSFVAVYESKSYSRAAELLHTVPSSVSYNVKELERQLDVKLFIAHTRGVDPTREADELYNHVFSGLGALLNAENLARSFRGLEKGTVRVGCSSIISNFFLAGFFMEFSDKFPKIKFEFFGDSKHGYFYSLAKRDIDLMLTFSSSINPKMPNYKTVELMKIENCFFVSKKFAEEHNLSDSIPLGKLLTLPLVLLSKQLGTIRKLEEVLEVELEPIVEAPTTELMLSLVLNGRGVGYGAEEFISMHEQSIVKIKIENVALPYTAIECSYSEEVINRPAQEFITYLIDFCKNKFGKTASRILKSGIDKLNEPSDDTKTG